jgi:hypothetical protein
MGSLRKGVQSALFIWVVSRVSVIILRGITGTHGGGVGLRVT